MGATREDTDAIEEREVKLAVVEDFELPALSGVDGVTCVDRGDERLRAVYWDGDDLELARAGVGLRHRNGVWAFKGRSRLEGDAVVREEVELSGGGAAIPGTMCARAARWIDPAMLHPIAELDTVRHLVDVSRGPDSVELVLDRVRVVDAAGGVVARFAEVEVEHDAASQALADRVVTAMVAAGAVVDTTPKLVRALRALGHDPPPAGT